MDPKRPECLACANRGDPEHACVEGCSDAILSGVFGKLADLEFMEREIGDYNLALATGHGILADTGAVIPEGSRFWPLRTGRAKLIDRRAHRNDAGESQIITGFITPAVLESGTYDPAIDQKDPGIYHVPYRYWDRLNDGYVALAPGQSFWVAIVEEASYDEPAEAGPAGETHFSEELTKTRRVVEMNPLGHTLFDRTWTFRQDDWAESNRYGFGETVTYDPWSKAA
jgi:hypothetical protein